MRRTKSKLSKSYLQVVLGVPVRVEDDAGVGGREVDAQPARPRAQQEHEAVRVRLAEAVDGGLPHVAPHAPVDALVQVPATRGPEGEHPTFKKNIASKPTPKVWSRHGPMDTQNKPLLFLFFLHRMQ